MDSDTDPQLRYYFRHGLDEIVCVNHDYFPHARSHDHAVILRGSFDAIWRTLRPAQTHRIRPLPSPAIPSFMMR